MPDSEDTTNEVAEAIMVKFQYLLKLTLASMRLNTMFRHIYSLAPNPMLYTTLMSLGTKLLIAMVTLKQSWPVLFSEHINYLHSTFKHKQTRALKKFHIEM